MTLKAGIIGSGNIAGGYDMRSKVNQAIFTHAGAYLNDPRFELVAAADIDSEKLKAFADYWGVKNTFADYRALIQEQEVDVISICTPDETHFKIGEFALNHGMCKVLFIEKPICSSLESARKLVSLADLKGIKIVVNYHRRWDIAHQRVAQMIQNAEIGTIISVVGYYVRGLIHNGCTMINTLRFLLGDIIEEAEGFASAQTKADYPHSIDFTLKLKTGARCFISCIDKFGYGYSLFEIDILGTSSRIRLTNNGKQIYRAQLSENPDYSGGQVISHYETLSVNTIYNVMLRGLDDICLLFTNPEHTSINNGKEAIQDMIWLEAILKSSREK